MSSYHPTAEMIERDSATLLTILGRALRRLDERDAAAEHEESFIGHCYQVASDPRLVAG